MRNLVCLNRGRIGATSQTAPDLPLTNAVFDAVNDSLTLVLGPGEFGVYEVQQFTRTGETRVLASFPHDGGSLLSFAHFSDSQQLIFVFSSGDLVTAVYDTYGETDAIVEVVGSIDCGIAAAQWSYDEETLVVVTNENNVVVLSRDFDSINETKLTPEDSRLSNHVDVGWGSKETQFRGKGAKQLERDLIKNLDLERDMNKRDPTMPTYVPLGELSEFDTHAVEIAWRKDCEVFALSTIDTINDVQRRMIRVFTREGVLESVSEPVDWLENHVSWGPLITSVQRNTHPRVEDDFDEAEPSLDIVFFERNGLRHGEFPSRIPLDTQIDTLTWNSNNEALAILSRDSVYIWTTKNYHWYLKQELKFSSNSVQFLQWHPEKPLTLLIGTHAGIEICDFAHKTTIGPSVAPLDVGMNLVVDGSTLNITPMSLANVPPPMAFRELESDIGNVLDACVSRSNEHYAVLTNEGVVVASVDLDVMKTGKHPEVMATVHKAEFATEGEVLRQIAFADDNIIAVLLDSEAGISRLVVLDVGNISEPYVRAVLDSPIKVVLLKPIADWSQISLETIDGGVHLLEKAYVEELRDEEFTFRQVTKFPQLCCDYELVTIHTVEAADEYEFDSTWAQDTKPHHTVAFGITNNGKLFCNDSQIASAITSLKVTESHLIITTAQHTLRFIHLNTTEFKPLVESTDVVNDERIRSIERGSLLVNVIPSKAAVILQAPRGNLETVNPRIMVLGGVRKDIAAKKYKTAFLTCRTHRIDLDILHDYDPEAFFANIELFVHQIEKVEYLDLFVSCLHEEDVTVTKYRATNSDAEMDEVVKTQQVSHQLQQKTDKKKPEESKINRICEAILKVLLSAQNKSKYLQTIITAYACEKPANLEAALRLISSLENAEQAEKSVVHLCFLQDVNLLYKTALGIYDVKLTLSIAQQSQMDPKEYLPFLQHLHQLPELRRKFEIDTHLKKHEKALGHLAEIIKDEEKLTDEFVDYVVDYELYQVALGIYKYTPEKQDTILELYAKHLSSKQMYVESGITYELLQRWGDALESYVMGQRWKEAMSITAKPEFASLGEETGDRLVAALTEAHKYSEAAEVQQRRGYIFDAVSLFCRAYYYADAILLCYAQKKPDLVEEVVDPALGDGFGTVAELLADCKGQLNSQLRRLRELREKKSEDPYAFYGQTEENDVADNVSLAPSETSTKESFFTRYTGKTGGTAKTGASRRTQKNKRREERKKARGKKGTIYEEEYLVQSVGRMIERLEQTKSEAVHLIEGLLRRSKREQAYQIQKRFVELLEELKANVVEIYNISEKDRERIDENGEVYHVPEIPVPAIPDFPKLAVLDY